MAYTKTAWVDGQAPAISAANLNKLETQYDEAVATATIAADSASSLASKAKPYRAAPQLATITNWQPGNGWSANVGTWTFDTSDFAIGAQSVKVTASTSGSTAPSYRKLAAGPYNLINSEIAMLIKVDVPTALTTIQLFVGSNNLANYTVLVAASGGIPANATIQPNEWTWVYFGWADSTLNVGTLDRTAVTDFQIRPTANSATPVTVWFNSIAFYTKQGSFPRGAVSFACDDGRMSQYTKMAPILDAYNYPATAYVIVEALGQANKITFEQCKILEKSHRWEIAGHAFSNNAHTNGFTSLTPAELAVELSNLRKWLKYNNFKGADLLAYPLGADSVAVNAEAQNHFSTSRQIIRTPNQVSFLDQPHRVRSYSVSSTDALSTAKTWVDKAVANGTWVIITMHDLVDGTPSAGTEWPTASFSELAAYVAASGAEVMTVGQGYDRINR